MSEITFRAACFSTNYPNFSSISIIKQYTMVSDCTDLNYSKDNHVQFKHKLLLPNGANITYNNSLYEISSFSKSSKICEKVDCFIIFFDLEHMESIMELNKILKYISEADTDKKVFLINIFTNENNIKSNFTEDNLKGYFNKYAINNFDVSQVNMDASDDLSKAIDTLTEEILQDKKSANNNMEADNSKSNCFIF